VSASATVKILAPDLKISKTDNATSTRAGSSTVYIITVENIGNYKSDNIVVTETVPTGTTYNAVRSTAGWLCAVTTCTFNIATLASSSSTTIEFALNVLSPVEYPLTSFTNIVTVADDGSHGPEATSTNNTATDTNEIEAYASLLPTKTVNMSPLRVDQPATYTMNIVNLGETAASGTITLSDTLPAGLTYISHIASSTYWTCNFVVTTLTCTTENDLLVGSTTPEVMINVMVGDAALNSVSNAVVVSTTLPQLPNATNTATVTTPVLNTVNLTLTKNIVQAGPYVLGQNADYVIVVKNTDLSNATSVVVTEQLPAELTFVSSAASQGTYNAVTGLWNVGTVNNTNGVATLTIKVLLTGVGDVTNFAYISNAGQPDTNSTTTNGTTTEDDTDKVKIFIGAPSLLPSKTVNMTQMVIGQYATYFLSVKNVGTATNTATITLTDILPANLTYQSYNPNGAQWICDYVGVTLTCNTGYDLKVGEISETISVNVLVNNTAVAGTQAINVVNASTSMPQMPNSTNTATATTPIIAAGSPPIFPPFMPTPTITPTTTPTSTNPIDKVSDAVKNMLDIKKEIKPAKTLSKTGDSLQVTSLIAMSLIAGMYIFGLSIENKKRSIRKLKNVR
jgi:uncharacterized repeat protein (TIGR01451 family)